MERGIKKEDRIREIKKTLKINLIILFILVIFVLIIFGIFMSLILKPQIKSITKPLEGELGTTGPISAKAFTFIDSCRVLDTSGTYVLTKNLDGADIPSTGCFNITASDVELNCAGYFIRNTTLRKPGIYAGNNLVNITIKNCNVSMGISPRGYGIYFNRINNSFIVNNTANSNYYGIYLEIYSNNNQIINNTANSNNNDGIYIDPGFGNSLSGNIVNSNGNNGISLYSNLNNNLTGNTANSNHNLGIYLSTSSNNNLTNNNMWNCTSDISCVYMHTSQNNTFTGGVINLSSSNLIYLQSSSNNNLFKDITLLGATKNDTYLDGNSINNTFINVSYNSSKESVSAGSSLIRKWYLDVNVSDGTNILSQAIINTYNLSGNLQFSSLTDSSGLARQELTEYINIGGVSGVNRNYYSNYSLNVSKYGYYNNSDSFNMTINKNIQITLTSFLPSTTSFVPPTPVNGYSTTDTMVPINVSIYKPNLDEIKFNWNGINYIPYDKSLVSMYNFNNLNSLGESSTFVKDLSKYGNDGTVINAVWTSLGKYGGAYSFDGSKDYITINNAKIISGNFTYSLWIKRGKINNANARIIGQGNPSAVIFLKINTTNYYAMAVDTSTEYNTNCLSSGDWEYATLVSNGSFNQFYLNGVSCFNFTKNVDYTNGAGTYIGASGSLGASTFFNGSVDEVMIFNRSLSAEEVQGLYASNLQKYNSGQWYLSVNQANLGVGTYSYFVSAKDTAGNESMTETRTVTISSPGCVGSSCGGNDGSGNNGGGGTPPISKTNATIKSNASNKTPVINKTIAENKSIEIPISPAENKILKILSFILNYILAIIFLAIIIILILLLIKDRNRRISENKIKSDEIDSEDNLEEIEAEDIMEDDFSSSDNL